jgi:hypothetical protein
MASERQPTPLTPEQLDRFFGRPPTPAEPNGPLLTEDERLCVKKLGEAWNLLCRIAGHEATRDPDLNELVVHVHALQNAVLAQAAGRAYPSEFRLLGERLQANCERHSFTESVQDLATQHDPHDHRIEMLAVDQDGQ